MASKISYPYSFEDLVGEQREIVAKVTGFERTVRILPTRYCSTNLIRRYGAEIYNFEPRFDDIWVMGFQRSGTTMTQELLYLLGTDLDYKKAASKVLDERFPFLERATSLDEGNLKDEGKLPPHLSLAQSVEKRFIKSHMGFTMLNPNLLEVGCKVVFIARNLKDAFLSNFYFPFSFKMTEDELERIRLHWYVWKNDLIVLGNYFAMLKEAWERRHSKNLLFLFYEEVIADRKAAITKIAEFISKPLTERQLNELVEHLDINNFKKNKSVNNDYLVEAGVFKKDETFSFIRKGKAGGWREVIPEDINKEMNEWIRTNLREIPDFVLPDCWKNAMDLTF